MRTAEDAARRLDKISQWFAAGVPLWEIERRMRAMDMTDLGERNGKATKTHQRQSAGEGPSA